MSMEMPAAGDSYQVKCLYFTEIRKLAVYSQIKQECQQWSILSY